MPQNAEILEAVARGYCHPENASKTLDPELCQAIHDEIVDLLFHKRTSPEYYEFCRALLSLRLDAPYTIAEDVKIKFDAMINKMIGDGQ